MERHVDVQDIVIKHTQPVRVAQASASGLSPCRHRRGVRGDCCLRCLAHLEAVGAKPGIPLGVYAGRRGTTPEGEIMLHAGFDIGDQDVPDGERYASSTCRYRGRRRHLPGRRRRDRGAWEALVRWIDDSGYRLAGDCRELYHEWHDDDPSSNVMELQQPIAR